MKAYIQNKDTPKGKIGKIVDFDHCDLGIGFRKDNKAFALMFRNADDHDYSLTVELTDIELARMLDNMHDNMDKVFSARDDGYIIHEED